MSDQSSQKMEKVEEHMVWSAAVRTERQEWNRENAAKNTALRVANMAYHAAYDKVWLENANLSAAMKAGTEAYENSLREAGYESQD
jgi:hypothetical protein